MSWISYNRGWAIRLFCVFGLSVVIWTTQTHEVKADYQSARADYQRAYSSYREVLVDYQVARSEYLTYQTIVSRSQAVFVTKEMLIARNEVIKSYLEMLRERWALAQSNFLTNDEYAAIETQIVTVQEELSRAEPLISNAEELEDLVTVSNRIDGIYRTVTVLGYRIQSYIVIIRARATLADATDVLAVTNEQLDRITNEGQKDTSDLERGLIDAEALLQLGVQNHDTAETQLKQVRDASTLERVRGSLRKGRQYIKSMTDTLLEVTSNIKIQD